ncbi:23S rRNA methyltransferase [Bacillus methanolicus PB1]|uniref:23S rRNA methyltransferase n=1 Tax=Bacillus methanolicus PB1 TaxID=997296 RepID=I3DY88_BACMT|nr:RNA methyltransferase [Bacillus methanolicus]EIJ79209.1 23S rRNA methyltransferase [Bacillus methanolicus PB1]
MKHIHSVQNPQVKQWKKLLTKKERDKTGTFLVEGFHLVEEALKAGSVLNLIINEKPEWPSRFNYGSIPVTMVTDEIFNTLSETETPQGVLAVCRQAKIGQDQIKGKRFLLIDAVQDPGNLGTMIRTADAAGVDTVIVGNGSVDIYNSKVLRSAQGSHFHLPVVRGDLFEWMERLQQENIPVYGTALDNARIYTEAKPEGSFGLIVGNEGSGVNKELLAKTDENLFIPIHGKSESLNVAVATGILLYYLLG